MIMYKVEHLLEEAYGLSGDYGVWEDEENEACDADYYTGEALVAVRNANQWIKDNN